MRVLLGVAAVVIATSAVILRRDAEVQVPTRRAATPSLLQLDALALRDDRQPAIDPSVKRAVRESARPIRSLFAEDFSDLRFLDDLVKGKRIVLLGESSHGVAEFNWIKVRLVKFLHERLGYDVIAFESSMPGCDVANERVGTVPPENVMRACLFSIWHTEEVVPLFEYLAATRSTDHPLTLAGFDVQPSGWGDAIVGRRLVNAATAIGVDPAAIEAANAEAGRIPSKERWAALAETYAIFARKAAGSDLADRRWIETAATSRALNARLRAATSYHEGGLVRDRGMADNLDELLDRRYPGRKVIVWAHNFHIAKSRPDGARTMGTWVTERRGAEAYAVGLFMGSGVAAQNDRKIYEIARPRAGQLEAMLANAGWGASFVELQAPWAHQATMTRDWGTVPTDLIPAASYDAAIYIDIVGPPKYR